MLRQRPRHLARIGIYMVHFQTTPTDKEHLLLTRACELPHNGRRHIRRRLQRQVVQLHLPNSTHTHTQMHLVVCDAAPLH